MARKNYDMVNEVLAHFDFEKVKLTMDVLDWKWAMTSVPTIKELKESAEERLYEAIKQVTSPDNNQHPDIGWISSSGGLKATAWKNEDKTLALLKLEFVVTEWDAEDEN